MHLLSLYAYFFVFVTNDDDDDEDDQKIVCKNTTINRPFFSLTQISSKENLIMGMSEPTGLTNVDQFIEQNIQAVIRT